MKMDRIDRMELQIDIHEATRKAYLDRAEEADVDLTPFDESSMEEKDLILAGNVKMHDLMGYYLDKATEYEDIIMEIKHEIEGEKGVRFYEGNMPDGRNC